MQTAETFTQHAKTKGVSIFRIITVPTEPCTQPLTLSKSAKSSFFSIFQNDKEIHLLKKLLANFMGKLRFFSYQRKHLHSDMYHIFNFPLNLSAKQKLLEISI